MGERFESIIAKRTPNSFLLLSNLRDALHFAVDYGCTEFVEISVKGCEWLKLGLDGIEEPQHLLGVKGGNITSWKLAVSEILEQVRPKLQPDAYERYAKASKRRGTLLALSTRETILKAYAEAWRELSFTGRVHMECKPEFLHRLTKDKRVRRFSVDSPGLVTIAGDFGNTDQTYKELGLKKRDRNFVSIVSTSQ
jgi:hypothetical protein